MNNTTKDLGILSKNLWNDSQTLGLIQFAQYHAKKYPYSQTCLFSSDCRLTTSIRLPILHLSQSKFFCGNILAADIDMLELSVQFPNVYQIIFFANSIPWSDKTEHYRKWEKIFDTKNVAVVAGSQQIYDIFDICWRKPLTISERLDYEKITDVL